MTDDRNKFYWHAGVSSGGTLSLSLGYDPLLSKEQKEQILAVGLDEAYKHMEQEGYIPANARLMSSRDIARENGSTRQYWEKLLNEGKILYAETSAGRITTDLWVNGYLGNREEVNRYVQNVRAVLKEIGDNWKSHGTLKCPACEAERFEYNSNQNNTNGVCRSCGFYVHTNTGKIEWREPRKTR